MVQQTPIICRSCKQDTGFDLKDFRYRVLIHDVKCPHCGVVVMKSPPKPMLSNSWITRVDKNNYSLFAK